MMCGGPKPATDADENVQAICDKVRPQVEEKAGQKFSEYKALRVVTQLVAGTNYFVKIHIGNDECAHARIYHPLPGQGEPSLSSVQLKKTRDDANVRDTQKNKTHLDDTKIETKRVHRIGKPVTNRHKQRPTIVKLLRFKDREEIIQKVTSLNGSNLFTRETFSDRVEQRRREL
ncbi:Cystatin-B [Lamellibrachia satsuma]|nr:Cystatin-B [Lamellibrachia satsuma]